MAAQQPLLPAHEPSAHVAAEAPAAKTSARSVASEGDPIPRCAFPNPIKLNEPSNYRQTDKRKYPTHRLVYSTGPRPCTTKRVGERPEAAEGEFRIQN